MNNDAGLQFFVLDISIIILTVVVVLLCIEVVRMHRRYTEQRKFNEAMEKTIDRILKIEAGAGGGIDGWEMEMQEKRTAVKSSDKTGK